MKGWIGVDLDGTLAEYDRWRGDLHIGPPVKRMVSIVLDHLNLGEEVRIFTARAADNNPEVIKRIQDWSEEHIGKRLAVTNKKDFQMVLLYDDRAVQVERNTGRLITEPA